MKRFRFVALTFAVALGVFGLALHRSANAASTATSSFTVTATVVQSCTISASSISFGNYDPVVANATTPLDSNGSLTVVCTSGTSATVGLSQGTNHTMGSTGVAPVRQMVNIANPMRFVSYNLYTDPGRAANTVWGDINTATAVAVTGTGLVGQVIPVYGRMDAAQDVTTGSYTDSVTATIQF